MNKFQGWFTAQIHTTRFQKSSTANKGHETKNTKDIKAVNLNGSTSSLCFQRNGIQQCGSGARATLNKEGTQRFIMYICHLGGLCQ